MAETGAVSGPAPRASGVLFAAIAVVAGTVALLVFFGLVVLGLALGDGSRDSAWVAAMALAVTGFLALITQLVLTAFGRPNLGAVSSGAAIVSVLVLCGLAGVDFDLSDWRNSLGVPTLIALLASLISVFTARQTERKDASRL